MSNDAHGLNIIYPDSAVTRAGSVVHLAVLAGPGRLERFRDWLTEMAPSAVCEDKGCSLEAFGADATEVVAAYDQVLRITFPSPTQATVFVAACGAGAVAQRAYDERRLDAVGQAVRRAIKD